jgi:hypothetical protein
MQYACLVKTAIAVSSADTHILFIEKTLMPATMFKSFNIEVDFQIPNPDRQLLAVFGLRGRSKGANC